MLITNKVAGKIMKSTGLIHNISHTKAQIQRSVKDPGKRKEILQRLERLRLGKPQTKHDVKELLHDLSDHTIVGEKLTGTYLDTTAHNAEKVLKAAVRAVHIDDHEHIMEQVHAQELNRIAHDDDPDETEEDKKKREEKEKHDALKGQLPVMKGGRSNQAPRHEGTPIAGHLGGHKAA